jgi:hypothetical protein
MRAKRSEKGVFFNKISKKGVFGIGSHLKSGGQKAEHTYIHHYVESPPGVE